MSDQKNGLEAFLRDRASDTLFALQKASKRARHAAQFNSVTKANADTVTKLIGLARDFLNQEKVAEAKKIMEIIDNQVKSNEKLQKVVEDALADIQE